MAGLYACNSVSCITQGAFVGAILGFAFPMWVNLGSYVTKPPVMNNYNRSTDGCPLVNVTITNLTTEVDYTLLLPTETWTEDLPLDEDSDM